MVNRLYSEGNFFVANYCSDVLYRIRQVWVCVYVFFGGGMICVYCMCFLSVGYVHVCVCVPVLYRIRQVGCRERSKQT